MSAAWCAESLASAKANPGVISDHCPRDLMRLTDLCAMREQRLRTIRDHPYSIGDAK